MEQYKRIAVIGGTGKAGTCLVNELISRGRKRVSVSVSLE